MEQETGGTPSGAGQNCSAPAPNHFFTDPSGGGCTGTLQHCNHRWDDGRCLLRLRPCRWLDNHIKNSEILKAEILKSEILAALTAHRDLLIGMDAKLDLVARCNHQARADRVEPVSDSEAVRVFALMKALDDGQRNRKAPLGRVFRLLVLEGLSQAATAKQCGCSPGLVSSRVAEIQRRMKRPVTELRALASRLGEMELAADDSRARKIYHRGLTDDAREEI